MDEKVDGVAAFERRASDARTLPYPGPPRTAAGQEAQGSARTGCVTGTAEV
jgi:hypothetical protein